MEEESPTRCFHRNLRVDESWIPLTGPLLHDIGVGRPEEPRFHFPGSQGYPGKLEANMTLASSNIGLYSKKGWGVQYEDTFVVTEGKPIVLTRENQ
ncbi:MAG: M24 family metallopeptidase [Chloroflexota bacterium]